MLWILIRKTSAICSCDEIRKADSGYHPYLELCISVVEGMGCDFVCLGEVLQPSQPNGVMSSAVSLPDHTFTGQAKSSKPIISIVHILSPETDNCPS